jgi:hypothetical protein
MKEGIEVDEVNSLITGSGKDRSSSTSSRTPSPTAEEPDAGLVEFILDMLAENNGEIEVFAFARHAEENGRSIPDSIREAYGIDDDVETLSWEDIFGLDLSEYEYVGYPPRNREGDSVTYAEGWDSSDFTGDLTGDTTKVFNGHYAGLIQERFAENEEADEDNPTHELAIRVGRESDHSSDSDDEPFDGSDFENAHRYQRLYIRSTDHTKGRVLDSRQYVGELTESEVEEMTDDDEETDSEENSSGQEAEEAEVEAE